MDHFVVAICFTSSIVTLEVCHVNDFVATTPSLLQPPLISPCFKAVTLAGANVASCIGAGFAAEFAAKFVVLGCWIRRRIFCRFVCCGPRNFLPICWLVDKSVAELLLRWWFYVIGLPSGTTNRQWFGKQNSSQILFSKPLPICCPAWQPYHVKSSF